MFGASLDQVVFGDRAWDPIVASCFEGLGLIAVAFAGGNRDDRCFYLVLSEVNRGEEPLVGAHLHVGDDDVVGGVVCDRGVDSSECFITVCGEVDCAAGL